jgi:hypothetical protein
MPHDIATARQLDAAASVLAGHPDPAVQAIGAWLAAGARGDLSRCLAGGASDGRAKLSLVVAKRDRLLRDMAASSPRYYRISISRRC